jgi:hypothetical protein
MIALNASAANGDTSSVTVWNKFHMDRYGNFDKWAVFPEAAKKHQNIKMSFTLGCLSNGQCEWDYTIKIVARQRTGTKDSTLKYAPSYTIDGTAASPDSFSFSRTATYRNVFNQVTRGTDSVLTDSVRLTLYSETQPTVATETFYAWPANFNQYTFDTSGTVIDSTWVPAEETLHLVNRPYYDVFDVINNYEIGRFISPYAANLPKSFAFTYDYDVTDYAMLLHDSAEIRIIYEGYSYGFTATVGFVFTEGTPIREAYKIQNIYNAYVPYGNSNDPAENYLAPKTVSIDNDAASVKFRVMVSGHGSDNLGCSEFCARNYYLKLDGSQFASQLMWRDNCGDNPIINQGGTWVYNRANWCPGELIRPYDYEMHDMKAGNSYTLDLDLDPQTSTGTGGFSFETQLISYRAFAFENDAAMEDILAPSKNFWHNRYNPICDNAVVKIKNKGGKPLQQAVIHFQLSNSPEQTVEWTGNLNTDESAEVTLPWLNWPGDLNDKTFKAWIGQANHTADENSLNDMLTSSFDPPQVLPLSFIIETRTNNLPQENAYTIKNEQGQVMMSKTFAQANTTVRDTITLGYGCYTFHFTDYNENLGGGNGLSWWAAQSQGNGSVRFVSYGTSPISVLKTFNPDFGNFLTFNFKTGAPVGLSEKTANLGSTITVYPQPAGSMLFITSEKIVLETASLTGTDGRTIRTFNSTEITGGQLDVSDIAAGVYLLNLGGINGEQVVKKIVLSN